MQNIEVITFNVGQGLFNLVTGIRDDGSPYCGVFDCGNFGGMEECISTAIGAINEMGNFTKIDDVVISHQDSDHWRMFLDFISKLNGINNFAIWYKAANVNTAFKHDGNMSNKIRAIINGFTQELFYHSQDPPGTVSFRSGISSPSRFAWREIDAVADGCSLKYTICKSYIPKDPYWCTMQITCNFSITYEEKWYDKIVHAMSDIIARMKNYIPEFTADKIENLLLNIEESILEGHEARKDVFNQATVVPYGIEHLQLGGLDCEAPYNLFKEQCRGFSNSRGRYAFLHITDDERRGDSINFERNILSSNGKEAFPTDPAVYKNATSEIVLFDIKPGLSILFPGDATVHTFNCLLRLLSKRTSIQLFIAPHHGSYHTNFAFKFKADRKIVLGDDQPLDNLLKAFRPRMIYISAKRDKYGHPSQSFMQTCDIHCSGLDAPHKVVYCLDGKRDEDSQCEADIEKSIYTTENAGNLIFRYPQPTFLDATPANQPLRLPANDLFISYGGFDL